jgi:Ca2+-binding RTX toxin-like protein
VQNGADTDLQWDQNGATGGATWNTLVHFQNTTASAFTTDTFSLGYNPDGSGINGQTLTGTDAGETITGTLGDDTINALGGNDTVYGRAGADNIDGGAGYNYLYGEAGDDVIKGGDDGNGMDGGDGTDTLNGGIGQDSMTGGNGNDTLNGGAGADYMYDTSGNNVLKGGDGDDQMYGYSGNNTLDGEAGNDYLETSGGKSVLNGGDGNDTLYSRGNDALSGGAGNDILSIFSQATTVDSGDGDDVIYVNGSVVQGLTTGAGADTIYLRAFSKLTVTDFTPGANGDKLNLDAILSNLSGWDGSSNPFGAGYLRLVPNGTDTDLQWDQNGATGGATWSTLVHLQNTTATAFTTDNLTPGYNPDGSGINGQTLTGTDASETINGTIGDDTISALGGDDKLYGNNGNDKLDGGDGNDLLAGGAGADTLTGGAGSDRFDMNPSGSLDTITDFDATKAASSGGDVLDLADLLSGYDPAKLDDFIRLTVAGNDTVVSVDGNGSAGGAQFEQVAMLQGLTGLNLNSLIANGNFALAA